MYKIKNLAEKTLNKDLLEEFLGFANNKLEIDQPYSVYFVDDKSNAADPLGKTAMYNPSSNSVYVYATNRHPKDILRSIAHELMHHKQNCDGRLDKTYGEGSTSERQLELEANEAGYLVREFEDGRKSKSLKEEDTQPANQPNSATQADDAVGLSEPANQTGIPASYDYEKEFRSAWYKKWQRGEITFIPKSDRTKFEEFLNNAWNTHQGMMKAQGWQNETEKFAYAQLLDIVGAIPGVGAVADLYAATIKLEYAKKVEQRYGMEAATMYYVDAAISLSAATVMGVSLQLAWKVAMGTVRIGGAIAAGPIIKAVALARGLSFEAAKEFLIFELKKLLGILRITLKNYQLLDKMLYSTEAVIINLTGAGTEELMKKVSARIAQTSAILTTDLTTVSASEAYEILAKNPNLKNAIEGLFRTMVNRTASERIAKRAINELTRPFLGQSAEQLRESAKSYISAFVSRSGSKIEPDSLEILFENFSALSKEELIDVIVHFDVMTRRVAVPGTEAELLAGTIDRLTDLIDDTATKNVSRKALETQAKAEFKAAKEAYPAAVQEFEDQQTHYILAIAQFGEEEAIKRGYKPIKPSVPTLRDTSRVLEGTKLKDFVNYCGNSTQSFLMSMNENLLKTELGKKYFAEALKSSGFFELLQNALEAEKVQLTKEMNALLKTGIPEEEAFKQVDELLDRHVGKAFTKTKEKFEEAYGEAFIKYTFAFRGLKQVALQTGAALTKPMSRRGILDRLLSPSALIQRNILGRYVLTDGAPVMYGGQVLPFLVATLISAANRKSGFKAALKQAVRSPVYQFSSKFTSAIIASLITYNRFFKPLYLSKDDILSGGGAGGRGEFGKDSAGYAEKANSGAREQGEVTRAMIEVAVEEREPPTDGYNVGPADEKEADERFKKAIEDEIKRIQETKLPSDIKTATVKELSELGRLSPEQRKKELEKILERLKKNIENIENKTPKENPEEHAAKGKAAPVDNTKSTEKEPKPDKSDKAEKPKPPKGDGTAGAAAAGSGGGAGGGAGTGIGPGSAPGVVYSTIKKAVDENNYELVKSVMDKDVFKKLRKFNSTSMRTRVRDKINKLKKKVTWADVEDIGWPEIEESINNLADYREKVLNERFNKLVKGFTK